MEQAKHTPGPWVIEHHDWLENGYCCISSENATAFANVVWLMEDDELIGRNSPEQEANARLISAAPDLKAVADNFQINGPDDDGLIWLVLHGKGTTGKAMFNLGRAEGIAGQVAMCLEEDRRAAIAKATGANQ